MIAMPPTADIEVSGARSTVRLTCTIDTGFSEPVTLPVRIAVQLGLELRGTTVLELADGTEKEELRFSGTVSFLGRRRKVDIFDRFRRGVDWRGVDGGLPSHDRLPRRDGPVPAPQPTLRDDMPKMPTWKPPKNIVKALEDGDGYWGDERWWPILVTEHATRSDGSRAGRRRLGRVHSQDHPKE